MHASALIPLMFIEQLPHMPSLHDRRKDKAGSYSAFI
jgi:hypothetical protein